MASISAWTSAVEAILGDAEHHHPAEQQGSPHRSSPGSRGDADRERRQGQPGPPPTIPNDSFRSGRSLATTRL